MYTLGATNLVVAEGENPHVSSFGVFTLVDGH